MTLREWLFFNRKSISQLAREIGVSRVYLTCVVGGKVRPGKLLSSLIETMTEGQVKAKDLRDMKIEPTIPQPL
jgi:hypothetical protein